MRIGFFGFVSREPSAPPAVFEGLASAELTSSAAATRAAERRVFVSMIQVKPL